MGLVLLGIINKIYCIDTDGESPVEMDIVVYASNPGTSGG